MKPLYESIMQVGCGVNESITQSRFTRHEIDESILDSDEDILKKTEFIKIIDKSIDILYDVLKDFNKSAWDGDGNSVKHVYQFTSDIDLYSMRRVMGSIDGKMNYIKTRYYLEYNKTMNSFLCSYKKADNRKFTLLITIGTNKLWSKPGEKVTSFLIAQVFNGIYQGHEYETDPDLEEVFDEKMTKKFGFKKYRKTRR